MAHPRARSTALTDWLHSLEDWVGVGRAAVVVETTTILGDQCTNGETIKSARSRSLARSLAIQS